METDAKESSLNLPNVMQDAQPYTETEEDEEHNVLCSTYSMLPDVYKKKFAFLLYELVESSDQGIIFDIFQAINTDKVLLEIFRRLDRKFNRKRLLQEILFTMKRFRTLHNETDMCKHEAEEKFQQCTRYLSLKWVSFFNFCEQVTFREVRDLASKMSSVSKLTVQPTAEGVVLQWLRNQANIDPDIKEFKEFVKTHIKIPETVLDSLDVADKDYYEITHSPCGKALIINQEYFKDDQYNRLGSSKDAESLDKLWKLFDFDVNIQHNLSGEAIGRLLMSVAREDFSAYDVFILCILSHGKKGSFLGVDNVGVPIDDLYKIFGESPTLEGKPKVFFIQACQNEGEEISYQKDSGSLSSSPDCADMLFMMSTVPFHVSLRDPNEGTVFIRNFVEVMEKECHEKDMEKIATKVKNIVGSQKYHCENGEVVKQMPETRSTLRKQLFLKKRGDVQK